MKEIVKERSTCIVRASFTDDTGADVVPTSMSYRVDDMTGGIATKVIDNTTVVPTTHYYDIEIAPASNVVLDQSHDYEERLITVKFVYGVGARQGVGEHEYLLKNMRRIEALLAT